MRYNGFMVWFWNKYWKIFSAVVLLLLSVVIFLLINKSSPNWKCSSRVVGLQIRCQSPQVSLRYGIEKKQIEIILVNNVYDQPLGYLKDSTVRITVSAEELIGGGVRLWINIPKSGWNDPGMNNSLTIGVISYLANKIQPTSDANISVERVRQIIREWSGKPFIFVSPK